MLQYLNSAIHQFKAYKKLGEQTMEQLTDEQLMWQPNADSNSIATIVKHMWGNMMSRWTDFLTTDGEKSWRERDAEFDNNLGNREAIMQKWNEGWQCLFQALESITDNDLGRTIFIRNEAHTVIDAINRQLAHYASHVGQVIYVGKMLRSEEWKSLSIPRNKSKDFNAVMFSKQVEK